MIGFGETQISKSTKNQISNIKKAPRTKYQISKKYQNTNLNKERTDFRGGRKNIRFRREDGYFCGRVRDFCLKLPRNSVNSEYIAQLIRSSSSPGANYIEANESVGDKDFAMKIKTCRRESKESAYWLRLVMSDGSVQMENERKELRQEAKELTLIFTAILKKRLST